MISFLFIDFDKILLNKIVYKHFQFSFPSNRIPDSALIEIATHYHIKITRL